MNVLSYAWFRSKASVYEGIKGNAAIQFEQFLPLLLKAAPIVWPGWEVHIHHDEEVVQRPCWARLADEAYAGACKLIPMGKVPNIGVGCLWRMRPAFEMDTDIVAMRDIDTIPTPKDAACVDEFIESGLLAHAIHDNPAHSGLMTGMIAFDARGFRGMLGIETWEDFVEFCDEKYTPAEWDTQGSEQRFLNDFILPKLRGSLFHHALNDPPRPLGATIARREVKYDRNSSDLQDRRALSLGIGVCQDPKHANAYYGVEDWSCTA